MPTSTEKNLISKRRAAERGILVPILEELLEQEVIPEDAEDFRYMDMLVRARALPRRKGVFSPSMLGSCMRQAYFAKRNVEKHRAPNPRANGFFLKGNFTHFHWQFAMWKAHRAGLLELVSVPIAHELEIIQEISHKMSANEQRVWEAALNFNGDGTRPGVEVRVIEDDFGGTIDVLPRIDKKIYVVDFKGINVIDFQRQLKKGAPPKYRKQIVGYCGRAAHVLGLKIEGGLLVSENKAGPDSSASASPIALHETFVSIKEYEGEVQSRLRTLNWHDDKNDVPPPECVSTAHMQFQECAFSRFCRVEVRSIQREREAHARKASPRNLRVSRSRE